MRTTVTLEPDTEALLKQEMERRGTTFKQTVNDAIRSGLTTNRRPYVPRWKTYPMGARVPMVKALQLAGELEDAEIMRKMSLGK